MHKAFKCLCYIGDCLCDGTLQHVIFPINITNFHWAVFEVDASQQEICYSDSLDWTCPSADINAIRCWLKQHNFKPFCKALSMPHGAQCDSYLCGVAALNTIHHAVSQTPLFSDDAKDILHMEEFLVLAYSHVEKSEVSLDHLVVTMILNILWTAPW
jgi:Ulp1 family protease